MALAWEQALISATATLREAIARIDAAGTQLALIVDADRKLLGTLSDGDVRRGLLAGVGLDDLVSTCMFRLPTTARQDESVHAIRARMRKRMLHQIPLLDAQGRVVDFKTIDDLLNQQEHGNWVVIMAGGEGKRLGEITRHTPKPMLSVGGRPLLETIVARFIEQGFSKLWLAVNYRAEQIEEHFGDGAALGAEIRYLRENKRMGTAGALSLLPETPTTPILVTNADLLTTTDYTEMLHAHLASGAQATMAVREYEFQIPFGTVQTDENRVIGIVEKPIHRSLVNAGMYVLSPQALARVPRDSFFDMPQLFESLLADRATVAYHRVTGYWLDIGHREDYYKADGDFGEVFS